MNYRLSEYGIEIGFCPLDQPKRVNQFLIAVRVFWKKMYSSLSSSGKNDNSNLFSLPSLWLSASLSSLMFSSLSLSKVVSDPEWYTHKKKIQKHSLFPYFCQVKKQLFFFKTQLFSENKNQTMNYQLISGENNLSDVHILGIKQTIFLVSNFT